VGTLASILAVISLSAFLGGILGLALWAFWFFASREGRRESGDVGRMAPSGYRDSAARSESGAAANPAFTSREGERDSGEGSWASPSLRAASEPYQTTPAAANPALPQTHTDLLYSEGGKKAVSAIRIYAEALDEAVTEGSRPRAANAWSAFMHLQVWMKVLEARTNMGKAKKETQ
jgi:hypothetical protein